MKIKNEKGILTLDYLFALTLVMGFSTILFALSMTFVVAEITQYMTFSSTRAYIAAGRSPKSQQEAGKKKYDELWSNPVFMPLFRNGWFDIPISATPGNYESFYPPQSNAELNYFTGVQVTLNAKILDINIPFYGSTADETSGGEKKGFTTAVGSYLIREPSAEECRENFTRNRWKNLKKIPGTPYGAYGTQDEAPVADNGC